MRYRWYDTGTSAVKEVATTAVLLTDALKGNVRRGVVIQNLGTDQLFVGDATVTTSKGLRLVAGEDITIDGPIPIWGISVGTSDVRILELQ